MAFLLPAIFLLLLIAAAPSTHAAEMSWTGVWDTRWAGGGARLTLAQSEGQVHGSYPVYGGTLEGRVEGDRLTGTWHEPHRSGTFEFVLSEDGKSFLGRIDSTGWWSGARIDASNAEQSLHMSQATPQDTLRAFLVGGEAIQNGQLEFQDDIMQLLTFRSPPADKADELKEGTQLWNLLDQFSISRADLIPQETKGERASIVLTRFDGRSYTVFLVKQEQRWFIEVPPQRDLQSALDDVLSARGGRVPPDSHVFKLETPRDTMEAFLDSMRAGPGGLENAISTLDLSQLSSVVRDREAELLAEYLNEVLARIGEVVLQEIPNDPASEQPYVHFVHPAGDIVIAPVETDKGVKWRFTPETLRSIRALYAATEGLSAPAHVLPYTTASTATFFHIRNLLAEHMPSALSPLGPLEAWQWGALALVVVLAVASALIVSAMPWLVGLFARAPKPEEEARPSHMFLMWGLRLLTFGIVSYVGLQLLGLPEHFAQVVKALSMVAVIAGAIPIEFWLVDAIRAGLDRSGLISQHGDILASLLVGLVKIAIIIGNFLLFAEALNIPYGAALAGLGIGGLAVALAARSTLENIISGFILFADRPLAVGDFCRFGSQLGTVEKIGIRSTAVRTLDRTLVTVPNADFVNLHLENFGRRDRILLNRTIALRCETTTDQLRYVLAELRRLLIAHPRVSDDPARVRFAGFTARALEIEIFAYVTTTDFAEFLAIREDVFLRMMDVIARSGTAFALPAQTLYLGRDGGLDNARATDAQETVERWRREKTLPFPDLSPEEIARIENTLAYPPEGAPSISPRRAQAGMSSARGRRLFWSFTRGGRSHQPVR